MRLKGHVQSLTLPHTGSSVKIYHEATGNLRPALGQTAKQSTNRTCVVESFEVEISTKKFGLLITREKPNQVDCCNCLGPGDYKLVQA